jgi:pyruvate/2-oxoglutarate/acetoin dehydrogenase E1 component
MMQEMNVIEALRAAMAWALEHDPDVVILGEDNRRTPESIWR